MKKWTDGAGVRVLSIGGFNLKIWWEEDWKRGVKNGQYRYSCGTIAEGVLVSQDLEEAKMEAIGDLLVTTREQIAKLTILEEEATEMETQFPSLS